ncbi:MAG: prenyltransferase [Oscillochloris sp.]|nr:prenyltransferase [Oscillochloris sp.]
MSSLAPSYSRLLDFIRLGRPLHLFGGALFYTIGATIAQTPGGAFQRPVFLLGLAAMLAIQLVTHYSNEYFDFDTDQLNRNHTRWSGGSKVLPAGTLPRSIALYASLGCLVIAAVPVVWAAILSNNSLRSILIALVGMGLAWSYSSPPLSLNRRGLGEFTGAILIPGLTALYGFQLQAAAALSRELLALIPLCLFQFAMLLAVNLPDLESDQAVGKRTLVVLIGRKQAGRLYSAAVAAAVLSLPLLAWFQVLPPAFAAAIVLALPIAIGQIISMARGAWQKPNTWEALGFWSIGQLMAAGVGIFAVTLLRA